MNNETNNGNSRIVFAIFLIVIGGLWLLRKVGFYIHFPEIHFEQIFYPIKYVFHGLGRFIFSWQMIVIIIGLVLLAGKRSSGLVLIIVGGIFILPKFFFIPGLTFSLFFPVLLIGLGISMVAKYI